MSNLIAACVGDMHVCPIKGHGSSPIMPNGSSILVEGKPIARVGDVTGCGAVITQGYPLALADGMPVAYLGSPTSHGGSIVSGNSRVILGVATNTAPVVDFAMAGSLDDKGQLTPAAKELLDKDPQEFVRKAAQEGALIDEGLLDESPDDSPEEVSDPIDELLLDVFGFSRGAATARHFISREVQDESGALAAAFKQQGIPWPKKITVRFVGLFDTVAGVADLGNLDFSAHDAETGRINVNLRPDVGGRPLASSPVAGKSPLEETRSGRQCRDWDFGFQGGAKGLRPGVGLIVQFMESARAVWRSVFGEVSIVAAGIVQLPGGFQVWLGPFFQTAVAGQAEEEIGVRIVERQLHQFHVGKVGIAAQKDAGLGPVLAHPLEHPLENHRVLRALRAFAGAQRGGDEPARQAFEQKQRQVAVTLVMVVVKRQFLLAVDSIFGVIHVEHDRLWRLGVAGDNLFH